MFDEVEVERSDERLVTDVHRQLRVLVVILVDLGQQAELSLRRPDGVERDTPEVAVEAFLNAIANRHLHGELRDEIAGDGAHRVRFGERARALGKAHCFLVCAEPSGGTAIDLRIDRSSSG